METKKRQALEAAGWRVGDAADFLGMTDEERRLVEVRMQAANAVRDLRTKRNMSQAKLATQLKTSQPRIVKIERADKDVSLDQILRAYTTMGGRFALNMQTGGRTERQ